MTYRVDANSHRDVLGVLKSNDYHSRLSGIPVTQTVQPVWDHSRIGRLRLCTSYISPDLDAHVGYIFLGTDDITEWRVNYDHYVYQIGWQPAVEGASTPIFHPALKEPGGEIHVLRDDYVTQTYFVGKKFGIIFDDIVPAEWNIGWWINTHGGANFDINVLVLAYELK